MRLLIVNPNTTEAVTERLLRVARASASKSVVITAITAPRGVPYIASRAEAQIAGAGVLDMLAERKRDCDAAIIAAFGDPGLAGARELFDFPILGLAESAMLAACMHGRRFAIVTFASALGPWYRECVETHGLAGRCAGIRMLDGAFRSIGDVQEEKEDLLIELANRAVLEDGADVVILAGAPLAGLAPKVAARIPVPVVDQMAAATRLAEAVVALGARKATAGSFRRPPPKQTVGVAPALAAQIEGRER